MQISILRNWKLNQNPVNKQILKCENVYCIPLHCNALFHMFNVVQLNLNVHWKWYKCKKPIWAPANYDCYYNLHVLHLEEKKKPATERMCEAKSIADRTVRCWWQCLFVCCLDNVTLFFHFFCSSFSSIYLLLLWSGKNIGICERGSIRMI